VARKFGKACISTLALIQKHFENLLLLFTCMTFIQEDVDEVCCCSVEKVEVLSERRWPAEAHVHCRYRLNLT
jgi:hypothetical protein